MVFDPATIDADGFKVWQPLDTMVFQWFPMVANHRSNDGMVRIHGYGLQRKLETKVSGLTEKQKKDSARQIWSLTEVGENFLNKLLQILDIMKILDIQHK